VALIGGVSATDWSWAPLFADFDNDGNKDLFISSGIVKRPVDLDYIRFVSDLDIQKGRQMTDKFDDEAINSMPDGSSHPYFFKGDGIMNFKDVSKEWGTGGMKGYYNGSSYADLDNDGNLDVVINCIDAPAVILKNNAPFRTVISLAFKGDSMNRFGIGAKAWLFSKGKTQYQELMLTRGFQSSISPSLHFGLDSAKYVDSMLIVWPNQKYQVLKNLPAVNSLEVRQSEASGVFNYASFFPPRPDTFQDISSKVAMNWQHQENDFLDYNKQYLIPHQLSDRGPRMAVADVNKDGLDDFYVCGASGQAGQLMIQQKDGRFASIDTAVFNKAKGKEKVDAVFFDANKDGWPDLYVASGGNEYNDDNALLEDNLYLNDGKGHFSEALNAIPSLKKNKSCVAAADIDNDGDIDLFTGCLANAKQYGIAQTSCIFINDGHANFKDAGRSVIPLDSIGMVTSAAFTDLNKDGWMDLIVTGEWMPVKIYMNNKGKFAATDIPASTGLWQTISVTDVNGDGFMDILAGNWGHNTKLYAGKDGPLKLYVKDFDNNGSIEQIMAYTINKEEYTFLAKDELERSLPVLKKSYLKYSDVAGKTVQYMFYNLFKDYKELKAEVLGSSCFINDGKGNFTRMDLPEELQLSPVFAFTSLSNTSTPTWIAGGNFYGVVPYEGRYDGMLTTGFTYDINTKGFKKLFTISSADGELRDMKWIRNSSGVDMLAIGRNNQPLQFFETFSATKHE
jgi:hypothetical protein